LESANKNGVQQKKTCSMLFKRDDKKKEEHHDRDDGKTALKDILMKIFPRFFDSNEPKNKTIIGESLEKNIPQIFTKDEDDDDD